MKSSIFWARLLGLYLVIVPIGSISVLEMFCQDILKITENPLMLMVLGIFTLFLGLAIIVNHNIWRRWPIIITILGYWITFKGIMILFFPGWIKQITAFWISMDPLVSLGISLVLGVILLFCSVLPAKNS